MGGVSGELSRLARTLQSQQDMDLDPDRLLLEVTQTATQILPGVSHGGVALVVNRRRRALESVASTGAVPRAIDTLQDELREGPCLESIWNLYTVRVDDYESETRWPSFVAALIEQTPVRSSLSIQLYTNENELGTLNLYSERAGAFTPPVEEIALTLAAHAAIGLASARRGDELQSALASRDIIGQAKGMVMERFGVPAGAAFTMLAKLSQESNTPLYEIARKLVFTEHPLK
jgi:GAF domain-containing protein